MKPSLQELSEALQASWSADTAYSPEEWNQENKARGHCLVSCLVIQNYLGGELISYEINTDQIHETHHMNQLPDGTVIDTTASQYNSTVSMKRKTVEVGKFASIRDKRLADKSTAARYEILSRRVERRLNP